MSDALRESLAALAEGLEAALEQIAPAAGDAREAGPPGNAAVSSSIECYLTLRDVDYKVRGFVATLQRAEVGYVTFLARGNGGARLKVYCVDPSHDLGERLEQAKAAVFFSGTLLPMDYHRRLLAAQDDDASVYAQSSFDPHHQQVLVASDVSARYSQRGPALYASVAAYLTTLVHARPGNYLVFLPSYAMIEKTAEALGAVAESRTTVVRQRPGMREEERDRFVGRFRAAREPGTSLLGLCVLGGIFGESIDLPGASLVGVVVVGTGMPVATAEREVIRGYFDAKGGKGFAYAYTYPGMIKVLQAAGRLIRTESDRGVVLLLDDRFLERELRASFPREWSDVQTCTLETLPGLLVHA